MTKKIFCLVLLFSSVARSAECTFDQGVHQGFERLPYDGTCSSKTEDEFLFGYRIGRKKYLVQSDLGERYRNQNQDENSDPEKFSKSIEPLIKKNQALNQLEVWQVERPEGREQNITEYKQLAPLEPIDIDTRWRPYIKGKGGISNLSSEERSLLYAELPNPQFHTTPLILAVIPGLGLGHALQGRYSETGWKFTLMDAAAMGAYASTGKSSSGVWAIFLLLGVKMWQAWDVGTYASFSPSDIENLKTYQEDSSSSPIPLFAYSWSWR